MVAVVLLLLASAFVAGALTLGSSLLISTAAVLAVAMGVAATRITHSELMDSRRTAGADRAKQAQAYAALTVARSAENAEFVEGVTGRLERNELALSQIEEALCAAQRRASDATKKAKTIEVRAEKAEAEGQDYARRLDEAEERAAEAIVRVAELEQERDLLRSELDAWQAMGMDGFRKHA
jgi:chromosome segregation ATPase